MPEAADKEYGNDIYVSTDRSPAASAKREIYISPKKSGQGQMPSLPEIYNR